MDWTTLIAPAIVAAIISGALSLVALVISLRTTKAIHREKLAFDSEQAERRFAAELSLAERRLQLDRTLADAQRRMELAEQVLADFYKARDLLEGARHPFALTGEGASRPATEGEDEKDKRTLDAYYATTERLNREGDFFDHLFAKRYRFATLFGTEAVKPFDELFSVRSRIDSAVHMLMLMTRAEREEPSDKQLYDRRKWETIIGWTGDTPDEISDRLESLVRDVEEICRRAIDGGSAASVPVSYSTALARS